MFSIIIPTFNNIKYLQLCLKSIKKNSSYKHEIIVHINDGSDGTKEFLEKDNNYKISYSIKNEGVCVAFNKGAELVSVIDIDKGVKPRQEVTCEIKYQDGSSKKIKMLCRIDTANEVEYYKNGGILQYVLRNMLAN